jgi:hypothetical protein
MEHGRGAATLRYEARRPARRARTNKAYTVHGTRKASQAQRNLTQCRRDEQQAEICECTCYMLQSHDQQAADARRHKDTYAHAQRAYAVNIVPAMSTYGMFYIHTYIRMYICMCMYVHAPCRIVDTWAGSPQRKRRGSRLRVRQSNVYSTRRIIRASARHTFRYVRWQYSITFYTHARSLRRFYFLISLTPSR